MIESKCLRCSKPLDGENEATLFFAWATHVFKNGRAGDATCIGAEEPRGTSLAQIIAEDRRERMH